MCFSDCCFSASCLAGIRLEIDGVDRGSRTVKLESTLGELEQLLKISHDPIEFMCQVHAVIVFLLGPLKFILLYDNFTVKLVTHVGHFTFRHSALLQLA